MNAPNTLRKPASPRATWLRMRTAAALFSWTLCFGPLTAAGQGPPTAAPPPPESLPEPATPDDLRDPPADAIETGSGLVTRMVQAGSGGSRPDDNDMVAMHYIGWTPYGAKFLSSYERGQPGVFRVSTAVPVWREAVQMMTVGERRRLWVPESLAPKSDNTPRGPLVFDLELLGISEVPNPPADLEKPPADAEPIPSGGFTRRLAEGTGDTHPGEDDVALVHWTGWTTDGNTFDSTYYRGRPTGFPLDKVLVPFADAVRLMVVGEKRQIWIPGEIAAGQWPGSPQGQLIFEVELLRIMPSTVLQQARPAAPDSGS